MGHYYWFRLLLSFLFLEPQIVKTEKVDNPKLRQTAKGKSRYNGVALYQAA